jgi:cell division protein FtsB
MDWKKWGTYLILGSVALGVGYQVYSLECKRAQLDEEYLQMHAEYGVLEAENYMLQEKLHYFAEERNIEKELRARFNYRDPDEKLIIVVPEE